MRFWIDLHGCAKNQVDGEEILARLEERGHSWVDEASKADLIIVNTCGFIEDAKKESIQAVISLKAAHPEAKILVAGCLAQRYAADLAADLGEADGIVGNADLGAVLEAAEAALAGKRPVLVPEAAASIGVRARTRLFDYPGTAHVKITEGCSNRCSYCAIPLIRGNLRSRPVEEVLAECAALVSRGIHELVLIGQDLGSYGLDLRRTSATRRRAGVAAGAASAGQDGAKLLPELLAGLSALPGDFRVRTLYIHPDNFPAGILPLMAADERLLPYFDLPFQHASARILKAMNRRGSAEVYLELLDRVRSALPDAVIRSTFLLGFPGETDEDFAALRDFQEKARLDWLGAFAYSREEGTAAYALRPAVSRKVVAERKRAVEEAQERITRTGLERFVGRELRVLVEEEAAPVPGPGGRGSDGEGGRGSGAVGTGAFGPEGERDGEGGRGSGAVGPGPVGTGPADLGEADEEFSLGRAWMQAPEVDGLTVLRGRRRPGELVRARILAVAGVDFDAAILD
ncbi:MAG: 30S ribosomal protein S12 methylthiotransferase RimO [Treponema sp.]|nr:30S ribosomal protein S12 methylthiotransferase RimO [Treponema sp.]